MYLKNSHAILGILLLSVIVTAAHLLPGLDNSEIENGIRNALHVVVFAIFAAIVLESLGRLSIPWAVIVTLLVIAAVGGLSEVLQYLISKRPDANDLVRDLSGAGLALGYRLLKRLSHADRFSKPVRDMLRAGSMVLGLAIFVPLLYWLSVIALNRSTFPMILSFDRWWETHLYHPINAEIKVPATVADWPATAGSAAEVRLSAWGRSGMRILPMVSDWTDYEHLSFVAAMLEGPDTTVTIRINDGDRMRDFADRFMARITVTNDPALIRIPLREIISEPGRWIIDLSDIQEIVILARDKRDGTVMLLDDIRVE